MLYCPGTGGPGQNLWRQDSLQKYSDCPYNSAYRALPGSTILPQTGSVEVEFISLMFVFPPLLGCVAHIYSGATQGTGRIC